MSHVLIALALATYPLPVTKVDNAGHPCTDYVHQVCAQDVNQLSTAASGLDSRSTNLESRVYALEHAIGGGITTAPTISTVSPNYGVPGDVVTITGTSLTGANEVDFNGTSAVFVVANSTTINATVPSGSSTGSITITTAGGTATSSGPFTVNVPTVGDWATVAVPPWDNDGGSGNMTVAQIGGRAALTETGTGEHYFRYQLTAAPVLNQPYIVSARVQAGSCATPWLQIQTYGTRYAQAQFALSNGTVRATQDGATGTISSVGNGEYDVSVAGVFVSANQLPASGLPYYIAIGCDTGSATSGVALYVENSIGFSQGAPVPAIGTFRLSPGTVNSGQSATLSWSVTNSTSQSIDNGIGAVSATDSIQVAPLTTTTYTISAQNASGPASATATLTVAPTGTVATPTHSPATGTYATGSVSVTLSDATTGAVIHYTSGSAPADPTCASATYSPAIPIYLTTTSTVKAVGCITGMTTSAIDVATYTISGSSGATAGTGGTAGPTYLCPSGTNCIGKTVTGGGCTSAANCASWVANQISTGNTYNVVTQGGLNNTCASDDSALLGSALAAAGTKTVYFPAGCYLLTTPPPGDTHKYTLTTSIAGAVGAMPTIRTNFGNTPLTSASRSANGKLFRIAGNARPIVVYGLDLDGGVTALDTVGGARGVFSSCAQTDQNDDAIDLNGAYGVTIAGNHIHRFTGTGVFIQSTSGNNGSSNVIIDNNTIEAISWPCIDFAGTGSLSQPGVVYTNNVCRKEWGLSNPMDAEGSGNDRVYNLEIAYNTFSNVPPSLSTTACGTPNGSDMYEVSCGYSAYPTPGGGGIYVHDNTPETTGGHYGYVPGFAFFQYGGVGGYSPIVVRNNSIPVGVKCTGTSPCN